MSQTPRVTKRLYSIEEAAQYLGRSEWGIRRLIWDGHLPHILHGRRIHLDLADMDTFIERNKMVDHESPN
jgi:excisionase family DNA binding protein